MSNEKERRREWARWTGACALMMTMLMGGSVQADPAALATEKEWKEEVFLRVRANMPYPMLAARLGVQGSPTLLLKVGRDGSLHSLHLVQSSGSDSLDQAALNAVWRTKKFPKFAPDMKGDEAKVQMPVNFMLNVGDNPDPASQEQRALAAKEHDAEPGTPATLEFRAFLNGLARHSWESEPSTYFDSKTGLSVEVPAPLLARASVRRQGRYDALIDVISKVGLPPVGGSSPSLCSVGLMVRGASEQLSTGETPAALENTAAWARTLFSMVGKIEREDAFTHEEQDGIELIIAPRFGPGHAYQRMYVAVQEYSGGRVVVSCATHVDAMERALAVFRKVRDGVSLQAMRPYRVP
ncbi:TPA: TonB family protein [Pseudomonas aeruginosa]